MTILYQDNSQRDHRNDHYVPNKVHICTTYGYPVPLKVHNFIGLLMAIMYLRGPTTDHNVHNKVHRCPSNDHPVLNKVHTCPTNGHYVLRKVH